MKSFDGSYAIDAYDLDQFYWVCDEEAEFNLGYMSTGYILLLWKIYTIDLP